MIAATRRWFRKNRTNLLIGAGVIGAGYVAGQYVWTKIQEARQRSSEDRVAKDNLRRRFEQNQEDCTYTVLALLPTLRDEIITALPVEQISEQLQQERQERLRKLGQSEAASTEYPSVPPSVVNEDGQSLSSSSYVHASQMAGSSLGPDGASTRPKRSKAQLWQDMKINSIARALTLIYTLSLLTILTRIQLNLLGRRTYISSVVALASPPTTQQSSRISLENRDDDGYDDIYGNDLETNRKYLTFSWWLLHRGSNQIMERVMAAVKEVFGPVNIREDITLDRLSSLLMEVRRKVEGATTEARGQMRWLPYLLPPAEQESFVVRQAAVSDSEESPYAEGQMDPLAATANATDDTINESLRRLLDETSDLVDSPTFAQVLTSIIDAAYSQLVDHRIALESFRVPVSPEDGGRISEISDAKCKLAHVLPIFCRQAHAIAAGSGDLDAMASVAAQGSLGNEYLAAIDQVHDLNAFAAVIYSSNFEQELAEREPEVSPGPFQPQEGGQDPASLPVTLFDGLASTIGSGQRAAADSITGLSGTGVSSTAEQENPTSGAGKTTDPDMEAAWKNALAKEDGVSFDAPVPVND
ncbi:hypothetical protein BAUCODRAFT_107211 [Baudoinia panamericana UAMH 10762]|uniref:Peroxin-3 n=1 Tax=Baudoinia panamericana (strain UAMH 10762) TaxID=717646 RepID=M2LSW2_BAUPA|nr:uncharacterized protein BAUCODRAFT_107211 [Baudoinia panamericana UAMH 10762]EMC97587.1 hypothetical protein BAUCODRAFT_107211 [Baudoinia panamericana UAMH 10762]